MGAFEGDGQVIIRWTHMTEERRPTIYFMDGEPIDPDWVAVSYVAYPMEGRIDPYDGYVVYYLKEDGEIQEALEYDTLEIALDQTYAHTGIQPAEWRECEVEVGSERERIPWSLVGGRTA